jgi:hypothetical protein
MYSELPIKNNNFFTSSNQTEDLANPVRQIQQVSWYQILSWSHIQRIMRVSNKDARDYYLQEATEN